MASRRSDISIAIKGDADFSAAAKEVERSFDRMEKASLATVKEIERAFDRADLSPEIELAVDTADLTRAFDLAEQLDRITADITVESDLTELRKAEELARSLRSFTGRLNLDVEGTNELRDALGLADQLDKLRTVKVEMQGRQDLERAEALVRDLDGSDIDVEVRVDDSRLATLDDQFADAGDSAGDAFAGGFDVQDVGGSISGGLVSVVGALGPWGVAAAGIGAFLAEDISEGFNNAWGGARASAVVAIRNSLSGDELEAVGEAAGTAYGAGFGESLATVRDTAALLQSELGDIDASLDLTEATRQAETLAEVFGVEVVDSVAAVDKLISQGLVPNADVGFRLLFDLGQQTGTQFDEMLELTNEFSSAIKALGIEGPQGLRLIGEMVEQGIFPQVDQAGEVFEELNETIISGGASEALQQLGVDATNFTADVAAGGPLAAGAIEEIAKQLLAVDDNAKQAQLTTAIFGGNMGLLGDEAREAALQLFATADGTTEVTDGLSDATAQLEDTRTSLDKVKLGFQDLGAAAATGLDAFLGGGQIDGAVAGFDSLAESFFGVESASGSLSGAVNTLSGGLLGTEQAAADADASITSSIRGMEAADAAAREAADGIDITTVSVEELDAALSAFSGRFDADATFRDIVEDSEAAAEAVAGLTTESYILGQGFDITTEAGRNAEAALEGLSGNLDDLIKLEQDGQLQAGEFANAHAQIEAAVRLVADQMNLTEAETQELIDRYTAVPDDLNTNVGLTDNATTPLGKVRDKLEELTTVRRATVDVNDNATSPLQKIKDKLDAIRSKTVTVTTVTSSIRGLEGRASGGPVDAGRQYLVGERGPELVVFPDDGFVLNAADTARIQAQADRDPVRVLTPAAPTTDGRGAPLFGNATFVVDKGVDLWQQFQLAEQVYAELLS